MTYSPLKILHEINALKANLSRTDYIAIKFAEGALTESEFSEIRSQRQAWRARINELQELAKTLPLVPPEHPIVIESSESLEVSDE